jgi:hypothetical protein
LTQNKHHTFNFLSASLDGVAFFASELLELGFLVVSDEAFLSVDEGGLAGSLLFERAAFSLSAVVEVDVGFFVESVGFFASLENKSCLKS